MHLFPAIWLCYHRSVYHMSALYGHYDNRHYPATMRRSNDDLKPQRRRRWASIKSKYFFFLNLIQSQTLSFTCGLCCCVVVCWSPLSVFCLSSVSQEVNPSGLYLVNLRMTRCHDYMSRTPNDCLVTYCGYCGRCTYI